MEKILKYLVLLLVTTLSMTFTACGGDDNDEPDSPGGNSKVITATFASDRMYQLVTIENVNNSGYTGSVVIFVNEGKIGVNGTAVDNKSLVDCGECKNLSDIKSIPSSGWSDSLPFNDHHGYICTYSVSGKAYYVKFIIQENRNVSGELIGYTITHQSMRSE